MNAANIQCPDSGQAVTLTWDPDEPANPVRVDYTDEEPMEEFTSDWIDGVTRSMATLAPMSRRQVEDFLVKTWNVERADLDPWSW